MEPIAIEQYLNKPRKELISERDASRASLRGEIGKFCRNNFESVEPEDLVKLSDLLFEHQSNWHVPLTYFIRYFGELKAGGAKALRFISTIHFT